MKGLHFLSTLLIALCLVSCEKKQQAEDENASSEIEKYSIEEFYNNISYRGGYFSHDESKLLISSNATGIYNLYALHTDGSGMDTLSQNIEESWYANSYFPNDDRILFSADRGGNEINHIYLLDTNGEVTDLTPTENEKASFMGWSKDLKRFKYTSNKRDPNFFDIYEMDIENFDSKMIFENNAGGYPSVISDDNNFVAIEKPITTSINELMVVEVSSGNKVMVSPVNPTASYGAQEFSKDNQYLYFTTNDESEFTYLSKFNMTDKSYEKVYEADWDIWYANFSWNETYQVMGINADAQTKVRITKNGEKVSLPEIKGGDINGVDISRSENKMRLSVGSSKMPTNIYVYDFKTQSLQKLTESLNPNMNSEDLVAGDVVRYPSFDDLQIPAILYKPHQATAENKTPVLVLVHGGPGGQTRLNYSPLVQYLVNHGYGVIGVNNRGSSGYGKSFNRMDDQKHGEDDLMDCIYAKDYLATLDWADTSRVGIIGGSYGGYMVMAALAFQPEAFDVGVNIFGVTNWLRTLKSIPSWWEAQRTALYEELGDPFSEDSVRLRRISPLFHAGNITKPVMVLQGSNDPRVLQVESDEMVENVKANGVPVEYVLFPDEGHGFRKKENEIKGYGKIKDFLDQYLK
ncbi:S9 family peptidase [Marivirga arenosa]|uniref:Acyl-peptide hydrolase n=1 Tax=Marivirga arenosa TaxID=3059076 RepID=A0AA49GED2_9BACT|nr:alpha/beta fold hydrolase [Marivirga sp. BKB1-2]WKK81631.2 alpha/beta fold hydrolase [Marivirga sp. BKB1-2]